jgi:MOSC domain-containing protein YiiM
MTGRILSVNLATAERSAAKNVGITGINKRPVNRPVTVRAPGPKAKGRHSGLVGDQIFDTKHHGGDDQAVYAYAREDYDWWERQLGFPLPGGLFGDNLTTEGVDVNGAVIGERWRIGADLVLEPTFGRIPCATFQAKMGMRGWVKRFTRENRTGAYLKVVEPGAVRAGDSVVIEDRPGHGVSIADAFLAYMTEPDLMAHYLEMPGLPEGLRAEFTKRLAKSR